MRGKGKAIILMLSLMLIAAILSLGIRSSHLENEATRARRNSVQVRIDYFKDRLDMGGLSCRVNGSEWIPLKVDGELWGSDIGGIKRVMDIPYENGACWPKEGCFTGVKK